jgi:hypothetical protein
MTTTTAPPRDSITARGLRMHRAGAPLFPPAVIYAVLTVLAVAVPPLVAGVKPWTSDAALLDFFQHHSGAAQLSAFLTLAAAAPLSVFTAVATTRVRTLGLDVPGRIIAQIGGTVAAAMLALAGAATLAATQPHVADSPAAIRVLYGLTFAAGGPAFVLFSGLLLAGISVTGIIARVLPRAVAWGGLAIALVSEIASVSAAWDGMDVLLPIGRFGGLVWMVAVGATLPATRRELRARRGEVRAADEGD